MKKVQYTLILFLLIALLFSGCVLDADSLHDFENRSQHGEKKVFGITLTDSEPVFLPCQIYTNCTSIHVSLDKNQPAMELDLYIDDMNTSAISMTIQGGEEKSFSGLIATSLYSIAVRIPDLTDETEVQIGIQCTEFQ